jgi:hypothetical protein
MIEGWRAGLRFRAILLAPLLAFLSLAAWAMASPVGASPDDDFHLVSTWCANGNPAFCQPGNNSDTRIVPESLLEASCYAFDGEMSASCQTPYLDKGPWADTLSKRGNFQGIYPPLYYKTMGSMAGPDVERSVIVMRLFNSALFVGLATALYLLLPIGRRPMLVWAWLLTTVPLGLFLVASTNPSSWAITGVGTAWLALLGYFETTGRRRIALGALFLLAVFMASGSRGDSALYVIIAIGIVLFLTFKHEKAYYHSAILPVAAVAIPVAFILTSRMLNSGFHGVSGSGPPTLDDSPELGTFGLFAFNVLHVPSLWAGVFGGWPLGWLDTGLPDIVLWAGSAAFIGAGFVGLSRVNRRKVVAVASVAFLLAAIPVYVLTRGGTSVGEGVQPRYLLPLIMLLGGLLLFDPPRKRIRFSRGQVVLIVFALAVSNFVSLQTNIRRYVTGIDEAGLNLDSEREWWWNGPITPNVVWLFGSLVFTATLILLVREVAWTPPAEAEGSVVSPSVKKASRPRR